MSSPTLARLFSSRRRNSQNGPHGTASSRELRVCVFLGPTGTVVGLCQFSPVSRVLAAFSHSLEGETEQSSGLARIGSAPLLRRIDLSPRMTAARHCQCGCWNGQRDPHAQSWGGRDRSPARTPRRRCGVTPHEGWHQSLPLSCRKPRLAQDRREGISGRHTPTPARADPSRCGWALALMRSAHGRQGSYPVALSCTPLSERWASIVILVWPPQPAPTPSRQ